MMERNSSIKLSINKYRNKNKKYNEEAEIEDFKDAEVEVRREKLPELKKISKSMKFSRDHSTTVARHTSKALAKNVSITINNCKNGTLPVNPIAPKPSKRRVPRSLSFQRSSNTLTFQTHKPMLNHLQRVSSSRQNPK